MSRYNKNDIRFELPQQDIFKANEREKIYTDIIK